MIHLTALVSESLDTSIQVGAYSIIDDGSQIGKHTIIHNHVRVTSFTVIGQGVVIHQGAALGGDPQDLKFGGEYSTVEIGDETVIREYVTINRGTGTNGKTKIGSHSLIMAYAHVAHDCTIGDHVIISNAVNMAGHVHIEDYAGIGGMVPIHQFCRIGRYAF
ncbi:MAG TPA: acyl-[acyl-carrier-protein]--UDP-N-acetylglucosamine O-acyltransferase, partial [bacterium]|nr:acyl-[acyl-carrier-protein]--UDP-N-acetylglucosamine O-acyltransferase [bacterium]